MLSAILLVCLLLPALATGNTVQQDLLCTDSYAEFQGASVGSNISRANLRSQLYEAFFAPNQHLPYSVIVTYQLVFANGTRLNLSSDQECSSELWMWVSSPGFLTADATYVNRYILFTLNYFSEWKPPHVTITTTVPPCPARMRDILSEMTASVGLWDTCCCRNAWLQCVLYSAYTVEPPLSRPLSYGHLPLFFLKKTFNYVYVLYYSTVLYVLHYSTVPCVLYYNLIAIIVITSPLICIVGISKIRTFLSYRALPGPMVPG